MYRVKALSLVETIREGILVLDPELADPPLPTAPSAEHSQSCQSIRSERKLYDIDSGQ